MVLTMSSLSAKAYSININLSVLPPPWDCGVRNTRFFSIFSDVFAMPLLNPRMAIFIFVRGALHAEHDDEQAWHEGVAEIVLVTFVDDAWELLGLEVGLGDTEFLLLFGLLDFFPLPESSPPPPPSPW